MNYCVYMHISPNGKKYIGITKVKPERRWRNGYGYKDNQHFTNAINKYGWDNFEHIIIAKGLTKDEAEWLEIELIRANDLRNPNKGYNIAEGGKGTKGLKHTEEWKQKHSEEMKGENNPFYGKIHTEESKKKMRGSNKDKKSVICLTTKRVFLTTKDAEKYYNVNHSNISVCCKGKRESAGKYNGQKLVWRYLNHKHNKTYRVKKEA